jgi:hypothetical protein
MSGPEKTGDVNQAALLVFARTYGMSRKRGVNSVGFVTPGGTDSRVQ